MTVRWREHPAARQEFLDALAWYDDQVPGLGGRLADAFAESIQFIREWPNAAALFPGRSRTLLVRTQGIDVFPYRIIYVVREGDVVVVAYAHERRRPGYWRERLSDVTG